MEAMKVAGNKTSAVLHAAKQHRIYDYSESNIQAAVEKMCAGYKKIEDAKKKRKIQVLKVSNQKSKSTSSGYNKNPGKSCQERIEWKLRQLKTNRRTKINRAFV